MATVVSTPQLSYRAAPISGSAFGASANATFLLTVLGWESHLALIESQPNTTGYSAGVEFHAYRADDVGANFETIPSVSVVFPLKTNTTDRKVMTVPTGIWLMRIISGGNVAVTFSFAVGTIEDVTAVINV